MSWTCSHCSSDIVKIVNQHEWCKTCGRIPLEEWSKVSPVFKRTCKQSDEIVPMPKPKTRPPYWRYDED